MNAREIREKYLKTLENDGHKVIPRVALVPQNDPTTLFTNSGMQPLLPYLLGQEHPDGVRLTDSQTCIRADDIEDVGDNRHTTFFEMLGNWSLGDYFKKEQISRFFNFLVDDVGLDPNKIYATCFLGDPKSNIAKDEESAEVWQQIFKKRGIEAPIQEMGSADDGASKGMKEARIFYYDAGENWWSRAGRPENMPAGEPGGPDSEVFYVFDEVEHNKEFGEHCHPACDCGRFMEIGNSVFMEYLKQEDGSFKNLPKKNVDFGGGLERISAAAINSPDVFKISIMWPVIEHLQKKSGKKYEDHTESMRVVTDHMRAATWLGIDGVVPSNHQQGYVMRRLLRRAIRYAMDLEFTFNVAEEVVPIIIELYKLDFPEVAERGEHVIDVMIREEKIFRQTLKKGVKKMERDNAKNIEAYEELNNESKIKWTGPRAIDVEKVRSAEIKPEYKSWLTGKKIFELYDTYGFPKELSIEEAARLGMTVEDDWEKNFKFELELQKERSRTSSKGQFKGGLEGSNPMHVKYHTTTHLLYRALRLVLGDHVEQRGSNITEERTRFDFNHHEKMAAEQIKQVEDIVNKVIKDDLSVVWEEMLTEEALASGARGHFGEKYGKTSKVYIIGPKDNPYSMELCGGPHVEHTGQLGDSGKHFKILKEQSSSAGIRRIKAALV